MTSLIYNSCLADAMRGLIKFDGDVFKVMLVTSGYKPGKNADAKRSNISDEVIGDGYAAGGIRAPVTIKLINDRVEVTLGGGEWPRATITARGAVYYKSRGASAGADELVAYVDFGNDVISTNGPFSLSASTMRIQN